MRRGAIGRIELPMDFLHARDSGAQFRVGWETILRSRALPDPRDRFGRGIEGAVSAFAPLVEQLQDLEEFRRNVNGCSIRAKPAAEFAIGIPRTEDVRFTINLRECGAFSPSPIAPVTLRRSSIPAMCPVHFRG